MTHLSKAPRETLQKLLEYLVEHGPRYCVEALGTVLAKIDALRDENGKLKVDRDCLQQECCSLDQRVNELKAEIARLREKQAAEQEKKRS